MAEPTSFQAEVRRMLHNRILDAAAEVTAERGWGAVTMSGIASMVGVSRQILYKEIGAKNALGHALVTRETDRFISGVAEHIRAYPSEPAEGIAAAAEFTLVSGADNALIRAIGAGTAGGDTELLPLLTTSTGPVLGRAIKEITAIILEVNPELSAADTVASTVEVAVRLTLSHLLSPLGPTEEAASQIRHVVVKLLDDA